MGCSFGFTITAFAVSWWFTDQVYKDRCSTQECLWYWNATNWVALSSMWVLFGLAILYVLYTIVFRRAEWLQHWRSQPKRPIWFWVLYCTGFAVYFALSQYARHHEELRSFGTILFGLLALCFMVPMCYRQSNGRWQYLCIATFVFIGAWNLYTDGTRLAPRTFVIAWVKHIFSGFQFNRQAVKLLRRYRHRATLRVENVQPLTYSLVVSQIILLPFNLTINEKRKEKLLVFPYLGIRQAKCERIL